MFDQAVGADPLSMGKGERKRGFVPASSVEAYQRTHKDTRVSVVVDLLDGLRPTTSAELTRFYNAYPTTDDLLYVRRGLSDAQKLGLVEHAGKRPCTVAKTLAVTWKVKSR
jgi:hypothetical protein